MSCANCGSSIAGRFCSTCGQPVEAGGRLTWSLLGRSITAALDLERGLLHTIIALSLRPGATIEDYLEGRRVTYTSPAKYLLLMVSLAFIALALVSAQLPDGPDPRAAEYLSSFAEWGNVLLIFTVPLFALGTRVLYRAAGRTLPEHLALNAYVVGHQNLLSFVILPFQQIGPLVARVCAGLYFVLCIAYLAWALRGTVARSWAGALAGSLVLSVVIQSLYFMTTAVIMALSGR